MAYKEIHKVCFFADVQYAPVPPRIGRLYDQGLARLTRILEAVRNEADMYVNLGDCINGEDARQSYDAVMALCDAAQGSSAEPDVSGRARPFIHVCGNHESFALPPSLLRGSGFTSCDYFGVHWIVLDGSYDWDGRPYGGHPGDWTKCCIPPEQQLALQRDLASCASAVVLCHYNLDPRPTSDFTPCHAEAVRHILEESGKVQAVIQGHYHEGFEQVVHGIPYHTLPAVCERHPDLADGDPIVYAMGEIRQGRLVNFELRFA